MTIIDARAHDLPDDILRADVCVVGAGAAGLTLASTLQQAGLDVCLLESGGFTPDEQTQSLYDLESTGYPIRPNYMSRARYFGGTCNLWAGRNMALNAIDFEARDWVPGSGWPVSYDEISRHYPQASEILGLPRREDASVASLAAGMSRAERALFDGPDFSPTISLWGKSAARFGSVFGGTLRRAHNARVFLNASVTHIRLNETGTEVASLSCATMDRRRFTVQARHYVLACGGLENARLLLNSDDRQAGGIGNQHGALGRYFMDHPRAVFGKVHLNASSTVPLLRGRPLQDGKLQLGIGLSAELQRRERLLNHYVTFELQTSGYAEAKYQSFVQTMKVVLRRGYAGSRWDFARTHLTDIPDMIYLLSPKELMPHFLYRWYVTARDAIPRKPAPSTFVAVYFCEQPPDPSSRVTLSENEDRLGMRRLKLHWNIDQAVTESIMRLQDLLDERLRRTGTGWLEKSEETPLFTDASHHMGTTRMSASPRDGVVDTDCRVHGLANLYVASSSVFPSAGHANPTLTIVAMSLRLAEHLVTRLSS